LLEDLAVLSSRAAKQLFLEESILLITGSWWAPGVRLGLSPAPGVEGHMALSAASAKSELRELLRGRVEVAAGAGESVVLELN
jgi:hypothetical protein